MPNDDKEALKRAEEDAKQGKSPSTQAGEFVREEIEHVRAGRHGARSSKQAIAIGLSKARRAGVKLPPPPASSTSAKTRRRAQLDTEAAGRRKKPSPRRSRAVKETLKREGKAAVSKKALSRQARGAAKHRSRKERSGAAKKAARTRKAGRHKRRR
jgi:hypothetical protein